MISKELVAKIRRLYYAEHWKIGTIASELGVHPDTVKRAIEAERFGTRSPKQLVTDPYLEFIQQTLKAHPRLRATRVLQMIRARGYEGGISQLRRVVSQLRPAAREAFVRLTVFPAEQAQADWASFGEITIGKARRRLSCFVLTLSYSRAMWLEFFLDQSLENFMLGHVNAFNNWGGVCRTILYDNLKSAVLDRHGDQVRLHPRLLDLCGHYHFAARPCNPGRGNEKGRVERTISYVRHSFFAARQFTTLEDFNRQALEWRNTVAHPRRWPGGDSRTVSDAFEEEKVLLIPLPANRFETDLIKTVRSDKTMYVRFDQNDYSIPPELVGRPLTLAASQSQVRILNGATEIARHRRSYDRHQQINDPAHMAAVVEQKRKALGATAVARLVHAVPHIEQFLSATFQRGESVARQSAHLIQLLDDYGARELATAVAEALERNTPRAASVAFILARRHRSANRTLLPVDLSRHPELADLSVPTHQLEVYDELSDDSTED
jgi:transposase